jgi:hypothetical protein
MDSIAAVSGDLDGLRRAHNNGQPWGYFTSTFVGISGNLDALRYVHENGAGWIDSTCASIAASGHLECFRYAHEHGAPLGYGVCGAAASYGHLECLRYAHEHGVQLPRVIYVLSFVPIETIVYQFIRGVPWDLYNRFQLASLHPKYEKTLGIYRLRYAASFLGRRWRERTKRRLEAAQTIQRAAIPFIHRPGGPFMMREMTEFFEDPENDLACVV